LKDRSHKTLFRCCGSLFRIYDGKIGIIQNDSYQNFSIFNATEIANSRIEITILLMESIWWLSLFQFWIRIMNSRVGIMNLSRSIYVCEVIKITKVLSKKIAIIDAQ
jgi:hypothetical protein